MNELFTIKNTNDNIHLLAFRHHTLNYSVEALKKRKMELKKDPYLKNKIDNYLLMQRVSFTQQSEKESLPFDVKINAFNYLNSSKNIDLKNYMNICKHIIAKKLDMKLLCSRVDFLNHSFTWNGKDLICTDCNLSTIGNNYNQVEKDFLYACAKESGRIVDNSISSNCNVPIIYSQNKNLESNLINVA